MVLDDWADDNYDHSGLLLAFELSASISR